MSRYTITIRQYLLSHMKDDEGNANGYLTKDDDFYGDFWSMNEVIDKTYEHVFKQMNLIVPIDDYFKKAFCKRFYNSEIGFEVWAQFLTKLEDTLNTTCYNLFKFREALMSMDIDEAKKTMNMVNTQIGNSDSLGIANTSPQTDLNIIYPNDEGIIKYADALQENHSKNAGTNTTVGSNISPFLAMNMYANITPIDEAIFNIIDRKCFIQVYN